MYQEPKSRRSLVNGYDCAFIVFGFQNTPLSPIYLSCHRDIFIESPCHRDIFIESPLPFLLIFNYTVHWLVRSTETKLQHFSGTSIGWMAWGNAFDLLHACGVHRLYCRSSTLIGTSFENITLHCPPNIYPVSLPPWSSINPTSRKVYLKTEATIVW